MTRRRGSIPCGTIVLGLALMPVVFAVAFFGLVLAAEAMGVGSVSQLERTVQDLLVYTGLVSAPATPTPAPVDLDPSQTPFQPLLTETSRNLGLGDSVTFGYHHPLGDFDTHHHTDGNNDRDGLAHPVTDGDAIGDHRRNRNAHAHADPTADPDIDADAAASDGVEHT